MIAGKLQPTSPGGPRPATGSQFADSVSIFSDPFVWRLQSDEGDATAFRPLGDDVLVNMSVWRDAPSLREFVYRSAHVEILRRRREWFERMTDACTALWWIERGHRPTLAEAEARLAHLRSHGPSAFAFGLRDDFAPPDATAPARPARADHRCPAG